jgi:hypothetical protein
VISSAPAAVSGFGPWNPGIESPTPHDLQHLCTIFLPDNAFTDIATARELRDLTGLPLSDLVALRPQRLALHELLVRVTADFSVPDGQRIEDLGINMRQITRELFAECINPQMSTINATYDAVRRSLEEVIDEEIASLFPPSAPKALADRPRKAGLRALFGRRDIDGQADRTGANREHRILADWEAQAHSTDGLHKVAYASLTKVIGALLARHGGVWGSRELIRTLAVDNACNGYGSEAIGYLVEPWLRRAAEGGRYRLLPAQQRPVVMNTKGPSASGKSTLRPLQKALAGALRVSWSEFALVSPDIWRKQLLDYGALGANYRYGGSFTGDELRIIDQKLDRYMARKAERGDMPHLLIDRFRFDSFAPDSHEAGSNLLTRFGHTIYLFFLVTPPESLVERAWNRGLEVGRYKAVDDTLAHCVEAYSGLPQVFFTWVQRTDKRVHFEFLDNSVPFGERPRTAAFGWNDQLNVLDVRCLLDIERFRRVDIEAMAPGSLYRDRGLLAPGHNLRFLEQCLETFPKVCFADAATGRIYLEIVRGAAAWSDPEALKQAVVDPDTRAGVLAAVPRLFERELSVQERPRYLTAIAGAERIHTIGSWGNAAQA